MKKLLYTILALIVLAGAGYGSYKLGVKSQKPIKPTVVVNKPKSPTKTQPVTQQPAPTPTFHVGDTQTDGQLSIKLVKTFFTTQLTRPIVSNGYGLFQVQLTVTNNGNYPNRQSQDVGLMANSFVFLDSGKYIYPDLGTVGANDCGMTFGNDIAVIAPGQTVTGCIPFGIPVGSQVDTYFDGSLKWFL